jgi:hypothetical protein
MTIHDITCHDSGKIYDIATLLSSPSLVLTPRDIIFSSHIIFLCMNMGKGEEKEDYISLQISATFGPFGSIS